MNSTALTGMALTGIIVWIATMLITADWDFPKEKKPIYRRYAIVWLIIWAGPAFLYLYIRGIFG